MGNIDAELRILKNIVRVGTVNSVDFDNKTARVIFNDKTDGNGNPLISGEVRYMRSLSSMVWFPVVGKTVLCLFLPNGQGEGFILGEL